MIRFPMLKNENIVTVDVDDTLVMWKGTEYFRNEPNIRSVIRHSDRGHFVIVWSQGGAKWADRIVKELGLTPYVNLVMSKPKWYLDDKPADKWMSRYWNKPEEKEVD